MNIDKVRELEEAAGQLTPHQLRLLLTSVVVTLEHWNPDAVSHFAERAKRWAKENELERRIPEHLKGNPKMEALGLGEAPITTKNGVLYQNGKVLGPVSADRIARSKGFVYAEQLVKAMENEEIRP